ncbi:MAG: radical SAM protein [Roseiflexus sp.]
MNDPDFAPIRTTPLILCAKDLEFHTTHAVETDCFALPETDCACPDRHAGFLQDAPVDEMATYAVPALHTETLAQDRVLAFNPLGHAGVVVLDQAAWTLLNRFRQPRRLIDAVDDGDDARIVHHGAIHLAGLGLLRRTDQPAGISCSASRTLTAWLHITNACNLRCDYCYIGKTPEAIDEVRGRQAVDAVIRSAVTHEFRRVKLKYAGGEATLNLPLIITLHRYARNHAAQHDLALDGVILSNGVALGDRQIRQIRDSGLRLMISLDGIGAMHDAQRRFANGRGSFARVERTLDRLAQHGVIPSLSITLSRRNLAGLPETVTYALERGLPFSLNFYRENDCAADIADLAFGDEEIIAAMRSAFVVIEQRLPPYRLFGTLLDLVRHDVPHDHPCGVGHSYIVINQRGGVAKCHMEIARAVTDIAAPDPLRLIREDTAGIQHIPVDQKEGCRECAWRYWCAGGCPALTYRATGRYDVQSPNCRIYQALFPEVLRLEGLRMLRYAGEHSRGEEGHIPWR